MNTKSSKAPAVLSVAALAVLAMTQAHAARTASPSDAAVMTLYDVAGARNIASSDVSFSSISAAASSRIEAWARRNGVSVRNEVFNRRGYTVTYGDRSYDCFRFPKGRERYVACVRDNGEFLGALAVSDAVAEPRQ